MNHIKIVAMLCFLALLGAARTVNACDTPSIALSLETPTADGTVIANVAYTFPTQQSITTIRVYVDGEQKASSTPGQVSGTYTVSLALFCEFNPVVKATAGSGSCTVAQEQTVPMDSTPVGSISSPGPNPDAYFPVTLDYSFPYSRLSWDRAINFWISDAQGATVTDTFRQRVALSPQTGQWIVSPSPRVHCPKGSYLLRAQFGNCAWVERTLGPFTMDSTASGSISASAPNGSGTVTVTVNYNFPYTEAIVYSSRYVSYWVTDENGTTVADHEPFWWLDRSGSFSFSQPFACRFGTYTLHAKISGCTTLEKTATVTFPKPEVVANATVRNVSDTNAVVDVNWTMPAGTSAWHVKLETLPWVNESGTSVPGTVIVDKNVTTQTKLESYPVTRPAGTGVQMPVKFTASFCNGKKSVDATVEGYCCDAGGPRSSNDPVAFIDGSVRYDDGEPLPGMMSGSLRRTYDSSHRFRGSFGRGWQSMFDQRLVASGDRVYFTTPGNDMVMFQNVSGTFVQSWPMGRASSGSLTYDSGSATYVYRAPNASEVLLFANGLYAGTRDLATGREVQIAYNAAKLPISVTDSWSGTTWTVTTDSTKRRLTSIAVAGHPEMTWTYQYDANDNLEKVLAPGGGQWRRYEHAGDRMTAAYDAADRLIESHTYDANGRAISSTGASDEIASIVYDINPTSTERTTQVTTRSGAIVSYTLQSAGNAFRTSHVDGGCTSCGARDATWAYETKTGRLLREQNADGYITENVWSAAHLVSTSRFLRPSTCDPSTAVDHCRLTSAALATAGLAITPQSSTDEYEYNDAIWTEKPTRIKTTSVRGGTNVRTTDFTYDVISGQLLTSSITGWTGDPWHEETHTSATTLYDGTAVAAFQPDNDPTHASWWTQYPQPRGMRKSSDGPRTDVNDVTFFVYYPTNATVPATLRGRLAAVKDAANNTVHFEGYDVFGNITRSVDANGVATEMTYDALGRPLTSTLKGLSPCDTSADPLCGTDITTTRTYAPTAGPLERETRPSGGVTQYAYDARGRLDTISRGNAANDLKERIKYTYDANNGKKSSESWQAYESAAWVEKKHETYAYDSDAQLASVAHADNTSVVYTYDVNGRVWKVRDENHASPNTTYTYDPAGRLKSVSQTLGAGSVITAYAYDVQGNLTSVTDPNGNVTSYVYDDFGRMLKQTSPVTGVTMYVYDEAGNLKATTDANNVLTTRTYDALNRLKTEDADPQVGPIAGDPYHIEWGWGDGVGNGGGRLGGFIDNAGVTNYLYDRRGLLVSDERFMKDQEWYTTRYGYDSDGNRTLIEYPFNQIIRDVAYTYDYAGRPLSAVLLHSGVLAQGAKYLPFGPLVELTYGNGTVKTSAYDNRYRMSENRLTSGATPLARYSYEYDSAGNITNLHDLLDAGYDRTFGYDDLSRLVTANTGASLWGPGAYSYDAMGNMQSLSLGAPGNPQAKQRTFQYQSTTPRIASVVDNGVQTRVTYDSVGNETEYLASREYTSNRMTFVTRPSPAPGESLSVAYEYDARGLRVTRNEYWIDKQETRHFIYSPEMKLLAVHHADPQGNGGLLRQQTNAPSTGDYWVYGIVWFGDVPVAQLEGGITPSFTFADHFGTPILQTSNNVPTTISWRAEYEPFGSIWKQRAGVADAQPLRLPGQESAMKWEGAEENYNIFRWYRSGWGRYSQSDPAGLISGANLYAYADGRPTTLIDPLGLSTLTFGPIQKSIVTQEELYQATHSTKVNGLTYFKQFDYRCDCVATGCDLRTKRALYSPRISIAATIGVLVQKGGGPLNDIPFYPWASEADVYAEELKHVTDLTSRLWNLKGQADSLEQVKFKSRQACTNACSTFFDVMARYLQESSDYIHKNLPHPQW